MPGQTYTITLGLGGVSQMLNGLTQIAAGVQRMLGPLAVFVTGGALARGIKQAVDLADAAAKGAQRIGMSVENYSRLGYAAGLADTNLEELTRATRKLGDWMARTGQTGRDVIDVLLDQADLFAEMPDGAEKTRMAVERFGEAGQKLIPLLNSGSEALRRQMKEYDEFGATIGPRFSGDAATFNDNLTRIHAIFRGMWNTVARALLPEFIRMQEAFIDWIRNSNAHIAVAATLVDTYRLLAGALAQTSGFLQQTLGVTGAYLGALSAGASNTEALNIANDKFNSSLEKTSARLRELAQMDPFAKDKGKKGADDSKIPLVDADEQRRMMLADAQARVAQTQALTDISRTQKAKELRDAYNEQLRAIAEIQAQYEGMTELVANDEGVRFTKAYSEAQAELNRLKLEQLRIQEQLASLDDSVLGQVRSQLRTLADEFSELGAHVAEVLTSGIRRSIDTVADGIWNVIDGTATWGEMFMQVGRQIISDLIRIALQYVTSKLIMMAIDKVFHRQSQQEAGQTSVSSGVAGLMKSGQQGGWIGLILYVALLAASIAAIMAMVGGFEEGGLTPGSKTLATVGEAGTEFVVNNQGLRSVGAPVLEAINQGLVNANDLATGIPEYVGASAGFASVAGGAAGGGGGGRTLVVVVVDTMADAQRYVESEAGQATIVRGVSGQRTEIGIPT